MSRLLFVCGVVVQTQNIEIVCLHTFVQQKCKLQIGLYANNSPAGTLLNENHGAASVVTNWKLLGFDLGLLLIF